MYEIKVSNSKELNVVSKALEKYREAVNRDNEIEEFLKNKNFKMGDYVIKKGTSYFDGVFGTGKNEVGKIVGWDYEYEYYRVYYSENNPYIGVRESELDRYTGEISTLLKNKSAKDVGVIVVDCTWV